MTERRELVVGSSMEVVVVGKGSTTQGIVAPLGSSTTVPILIQEIPRMEMWCNECFRKEIRLVVMGLSVA